MIIRFAVKDGTKRGQVRLKKRVVWVFIRYDIFETICFHD